MAFFLALFLQVLPQLPVLDLPPGVGGEIEGPYIFREDVGQTTKVILKNGLTVLVRESNALPLASITTLVRAGYFDEADRVAGVAHLVEHMVLKGTPSRPVGQIARETRALGGYPDSYTEYDRTVYSTVVPSGHTVAALEIQADALWNPTFDADELTKEIEIVLEENNRTLDSPSDVARERLYETAFRSHPLRRPRIGTSDQLRANTREDVVEFYERYYQPSNTILSVVGRFERERMLEEIIRIHGDQPDVIVEREAPPLEPSQSSFRYNWERGDIAQAEVALGFHVPNATSEDMYALEVLSALLTSGRASRMNRFLRDEQQVISRASSSLQNFDGLSYFRLSVETVDPVAAEIAVLTEFERLRRYGVTEEQLLRARTLAAQDFYHRMETVQGIADELASQEALGDWKRSERFLSGIQAVTSDDVDRLLESHFGPENLGLFEYLPRSIARSYSDDDFRSNVLDQIPENFVERSIEQLPVSTSIRLLNDELVHDVLGTLVRRSILRGPDVYVLEDHRLPLVSFGIFFPGGRLLESGSNAGITELMLRASLKGTRRYNASDIARRMENAGARIEVVNEPDFFGYLLDGVSGQMDEALKVLMEVVQEPTFSELVVEAEQRLQRARIRRLRQDGFEHPVQLALGALFDGNAYGQSRYGAESSLDSVTRDDLIAWHRQNQRTLVPVIVIVGDIRGTGLVASIAETLTNEDLFERDISTLPAPQIDPEPAETVEILPRRQTAVVYGFPGPVYGGRDHVPLTLLQNVVSGPGGRFVDAIREQQGIAHSVTAAVRARVRSGAFLVFAAVSPGNEARVRASIEAEIARLIADGISEDELRWAADYSIGIHEIGLQTRRARAMAFTRAIYAGADIEIVADFESRVRLLDRDDVQAAARKYLDTATAKVAIVRGQD